jgi:hypothetical protein
VSRATEHARKTVEKATADLEKWQGKVFDATAQHAGLQATAGDALLDDPDAEERIDRELVRLQSQARTAATAVSTAQERLAGARRQVLQAEAEEEDAAGAAAEKELTKHQAKVDALLKQLEELDGVVYDPRTPDTVRWDGGAPLVLPTQRSETLRRLLLHHRQRAAVLRFVHVHGTVPTVSHELDVRWPGWSPGLPVTEVPQTAREYVASTS